MSNTQIPSYSGVTINISNPTVNAVPYQNGSSAISVSPEGRVQPQTVTVTNPIRQVSSSETSQMQTNTADVEGQAPQAYPPSYYLNNYNYQQNGTVPDSSGSSSQPADYNVPEISAEPKEENMSASTDIINELNAREAKQKELEENGKKTRIVALTDEYIMSLENYLNNQNTDIRLMAAKEVLTRLDEDKSRFDDKALNALLNKMLQDPQKLIRIAALSAFSSGLAGGNDYTVQLLNNIQQNPNSDKEDVVEAANILLKMSADTEIKYVPAKNEVSVQEGQKAEK